MFFGMLLLHWYKELSKLNIPKLNIPKLNRSNIITLTHTGLHFLVILLPFYNSRYNFYYILFSLIYTQWLILGKCIIKGDDSIGGYNDFVSTFYILGIFKEPEYENQLDYISNIITIPTYIYSGFASGYGLYSLIYPILFITGLNIGIHNIIDQNINYRC